MKGYIVNFYKYATFPQTLKESMRDYIANNKIDNKGIDSDGNGDDALKKTLLVYGDFDRLSIKSVSKFERYRDVEKYAQKWLGPRQSILLYQLEDMEEPDLISKIFDKTNIMPYRNFVVFTMVTLNPTLHNCSDFGSILGECIKLIHTQVNAQKNDNFLIEPDEFDFEVYGSFSSSELVIVWSANQYHDAICMTNMLRDAHFKCVAGQYEPYKPFMSFYSVVAQEKAPEGTAGSGIDIQGEAELRLIFQECVSSADVKNQFLNNFKEVAAQSLGTKADQIQEYPTVGEYDLCLRFPAKYLCNPYLHIFRRGGPLHWDNENISKAISTTHVQLYYEISNNLCLTSLEISKDDMDAIQHREIRLLTEELKHITNQVYGDNSLKESVPDGASSKILEQYRRVGLRKIIKDIFPKSDGLCDTLDLLFSDYVNNCSNLTSTTWAHDLTVQFSEMLDYIATQLILTLENTEYVNKVNIFQRIKRISSVYIQMIYHIAQSKRTIFIVPSCHLRYMGQYDMILHAYYGLEKYLLKLAYMLPHDDVQPTLIPIFTIDVIPEIRTDMYKVTHHFDMDRTFSAIFSINMPLAAMTDFLHYSMVICHETAHFIAPISREKRNQIMGMLFFSEFVAWCALREFCIDIMEDSDKADLYRKLFQRLLQSIIVIAYNDFRTFYIERVHTSICRNSTEDGKSGGGSEYYKQWKEYSSMLSRTLMQLKDDSNALEAIVTFFDRESEAIQAGANDVINELKRTSRHQGGDGLLNITEDDYKVCMNKLEMSAKITVNTKISANKLKDDLIRIMPIYKDKMLSLSYAFTEGYREACQDLFMVSLFGLELVDYLVFRDRQRIDILMLDVKRKESDDHRTAMVCDYLLSKTLPGGLNTPAELLLEKFDGLAASYFKLMKQIVGKKGEGDQGDDRDIRIKKAFELSRSAYASYLFRYNVFRQLFGEQLKEIGKEGSKVFGRKNPMPDFYLNWKNAVLGDKDDRRSKIFKNNVAMIQYFQKQDTLKNLNTHNINKKGGRQTSSGI